VLLLQHGLCTGARSVRCGGLDPSVQSSVASFQTGRKVDCIESILILILVIRLVLYLMASLLEDDRSISKRGIYKL